jgi:hypothetical protein
MALIRGLQHFALYQLKRNYHIFARLQEFWHQRWLGFGWVDICNSICTVSLMGFFLFFFSFIFRPLETTHERNNTITLYLRWGTTEFISYDYDAIFEIVLSYVCMYVWEGGRLSEIKMTMDFDLCTSSEV